MEVAINFLLLLLLPQAVFLLLSSSMMLSWMGAAAGGGYDDDDDEVSSSSMATKICLLAYSLVTLAAMFHIFRPFIFHEDDLFTDSPPRFNNWDGDDGGDDDGGGGGNPADDDDNGDNDDDDEAGDDEDDGMNDDDNHDDNFDDDHDDNFDDDEDDDDTKGDDEEMDDDDAYSTTVKEGDDDDDDDEDEMINVTVWEDGEVVSDNCWLRWREVVGPTRDKFMYRLHQEWREEDPNNRPILPWPTYLDHPWPGYSLEFLTADDVSVYPDHDDDWLVRGPLIRKVYITKLHLGEDEESDDDDDDENDEGDDDDDDDDDEKMINVQVWEDSDDEESDRSYWVRRREVMGPTWYKLGYRLHLLWHEEDPDERPILPRPTCLDHPWPGYSLEFLTADDVSVYPESADDWRARGPLIRKVYITKLHHP